MTKTTLLAAAALSTLTLSAHAFGPFGAIIQNQIQTSVQNAVGTATDAAINAGVNAAVASATSGTNVTPDQAATAAGTATGAAQFATSGQGQALGQAMTNGSLTGSGKAWVLGNLAVGAAAKGIQNAVNDKPAAGGISYTLGADTSANIHAMAAAYTQGLQACGQDSSCQSCMQADFQAQSASAVGKTGTHTMGGACLGTTTAGVSPAAGK